MLGVPETIVSMLKSCVLTIQGESLSHDVACGKNLNAVDLDQTVHLEHNEENTHRILSTAWFSKVRSQRFEALQFDAFEMRIFAQSRLDFINTSREAQTMTRFEIEPCVGQLSLCFVGPS